MKEPSRQIQEYRAEKREALGKRALQIANPKLLNDKPLSDLELAFVKAALKIAE